MSLSGVKRKKKSSKITTFWERGSTAPHSIVHYSSVPQSTVHCCTEPHSTVHYSTAPYSTAKHRTLSRLWWHYWTHHVLESVTRIDRDSVVKYSTVQYCTIQYSTAQYSTVQYSTVQYTRAQCRHGHTTLCTDSVQHLSRRRLGAETWHFPPQLSQHHAPPRPQTTTPPDYHAPRLPHPQPWHQH